MLDGYHGWSGFLYHSGSRKRLYGLRWNKYRLCNLLYDGMGSRFGRDLRYYISNHLHGLFLCRVLLVLLLRSRWLICFGAHGQKFNETT
jgi:hypothetical protein